MSDGAQFPKKSETDEIQPSGSNVEIQRSDDPDFGNTTSTGRRGLPSMQGQQMGCGSSVFALMLVGAVVAGIVVL